MPHGRKGAGAVVRTLVLPWLRAAFVGLPDHALYGAAWGIAYRALTREHLPSAKPARCGAPPCDRAL